jgi:hypothetical protein
MRQFVESLKRLYRNGKITQNKVTILFKENKITVQGDKIYGRRKEIYFV